MSAIERRVADIEVYYMPTAVHTEKEKAEAERFRVMETQHESPEKRLDAIDAKLDRLLRPSHHNE